MRKVRFMSLIMSILSSLVIFSVGFSSWIEFAPTTKFDSGSFTAHPVLSIETEDMSVFHFSATSFKEVTYEDGNLKTYTDSKDGVGTITVRYKIPAASIQSVGGRLIVNISLGYVDANTETLFTNAFVTNSTTNYLVVRLDGEAINAQSVHITKNEDNDEVITFQHTYSALDQTQDYEFTVTYEFHIPSANMNFRNTFGKYIKGSDGGGTPTKFTTTAYVTEG